MVTIERIRYFLSVSETLSFSQTARACFVSQTAISQQIAQLEEELGVPLFTRHCRKVSLTPAGKHLLPMARKLYKDYTAMLDDMERSYHHPGSITVAINGNLEAQIMACAIPRFHEEYPGILVQPKLMPPERMARAFEEGTTDLTFAVTGEIEAPEDAATEVIAGFMGLAVSDRHPLAARESIRTAELPGLPLVLLRDNNMGFRSAGLLNAWIHEAGCRDEDILWADSIEEQEFMVSIGQGVSFLPDRLSCRGIRVIPLEDVRIPYSVSIYSHRHTKEQDALIRCFCEAAEG